MNARELGIVDEDLADRISGQYRVFKKLPKSYERGISDLKDKYKVCRTLYNMQLNFNTSKLCNYASKLICKYTTKTLDSPVFFYFYNTIPDK